MHSALARRSIHSAAAFIVSLLALWGIGSFSPRAHADDLPFGPRHGVLLLRNGEVIEGDITFAGDRYDVAVASGQMHIRRSEVQFVGDSILECYERRKAGISVDKVQDHLELAEWCLRHHLYQQAALALADAVATDSSHPRIGLLERRLKLELDQQASGGPHAKEGEPEPVSSRDLDRMVQGLPGGSVEAFTATIQPMLLNHCSTAGCHGPQGTASLRLLRIPNGKVPSRRVTQRNLYAVLSAVDQANPAQSPLLLAPMRPHGQAKSAVFTSREALQYQQLVHWVYTISSQQAPAASTANVGDPRLSRSALRHHTAKATPRGAAKSAEPGTVRTGVSHLANPWALENSAKEAPAEDEGKRPADEGEKRDEADPFDPQAFNNRYLKAPTE
ncbi:MAG TPA: hypothetical protein VMF30_08715 [Pirellulales bacterium]|nr:hypothetical protein [Pirellulales bacterium]